MNVNRRYLAPHILLSHLEGGAALLFPGDRSWAQDTCSLSRFFCTASFDIWQREIIKIGWIMYVFPLHIHFAGMPSHGYKRSHANMGCFALGAVKSLPKYGNSDRVFKVCEISKEWFITDTHTRWVHKDSLLLQHSFHCSTLTLRTWAMWG